MTQERGSDGCREVGEGSEEWMYVWKEGHFACKSNTAERDKRELCSRHIKGKELREKVRKHRKRTNRVRVRTCIQRVMKKTNSDKNIKA